MVLNDPGTSSFGLDGRLVWNGVDTGGRFWYPITAISAFGYLAPTVSWWRTGRGYMGSRSICGPQLNEREKGRLLFERRGFRRKFFIQRSKEEKSRQAIYRNKRCQTVLLKTYTVRCSIWRGPRETSFFLYLSIKRCCIQVIFGWYYFLSAFSALDCWSCAAGCMIQIEVRSSYHEYVRDGM